MQGEEYYPIPQVLHAFDRGAALWLHDCEYCTTAFNPFDKYMAMFEERKNRGDAQLRELKAKYPTKVGSSKYDAEDREAHTKATYDRTIAKLFLNGLLGRLNMEVDRVQHVITR